MNETGLCNELLACGPAPRKLQERFVCRPGGRPAGSTRQSAASPATTTLTGAAALLVATAVLSCGAERWPPMRPTPDLTGSGRLGRARPTADGTGFRRPRSGGHRGRADARPGERPARSQAGAAAMLGDLVDWSVDQAPLRECIETQRCPWCDREGLRSLANHTVLVHEVYAHELRELAGLASDASLCSRELSECHRKRAREQETTQWLHRPEVRIAGAATREANYDDDQRRRRVEHLDAVRDKAIEAFRRSLRAESDDPELSAAKVLQRHLPPRGVPPPAHENLDTPHPRTLRLRTSGRDMILMPGRCSRGGCWNFVRIAPLTVGPAAHNYERHYKLTALPPAKCTYSHVLTRYAEYARCDGS